MTGQGSSPHPAVALSDACGTLAQGPQGGQWWGEAVPAAGREQGAGLGAALARRTGAARLCRISLGSVFHFDAAFEVKRKTTTLGLNRAARWLGLCIAFVHPRAGWSTQRGNTFF